MVLIAIWVGTLAAGIGSVWIAAALSFGALARYTQHMLSLAAGALLATAFLHLLPEAFESQAGAHDLFLTLLVGLGLYLAMRHFFAMGGTRLSGVMAGTQTQPAVLAFAQERTGGDQRVALGYALVFPAAMITKIIAATLLVTL